MTHFISVKDPETNRILIRNISTVAVALTLELILILYAHVRTDIIKHYSVYKIQIVVPVDCIPNLHRISQLHRCKNLCMIYLRETKYRNIKM